MNKKVFIAIEILALVVLVCYVPLVMNPSLILGAPEGVSIAIMMVGIVVAIATLGVLIVAVERAVRWAKMKLKKLKRH